MLGQFKYRIKFQELKIVSQPGGGGKEQWTDVLSTWTKKNPLRAGRSLEDNQVVMKTTFRFEIMRRSAVQIKKDMRIVFKNQNFTVTSIVPLDEFSTEITGILEE